MQRRSKSLIVFGFVLQLLAFPLLALAQSGASWIAPRDDANMQKLFTPSIRTHLGQNECFIMPIAINNRFIGLFYCDRAIKKRPLQRQDFNVFVEFIQQANIGINLSKK